MKKLDTSKPVKLVNPQPGEENIIYIITNYNEVTRRCYIQPVGELFTNAVRPEELVSVTDLQNL